MKIFKKILLLLLCAVTLVMGAGCAEIGEFSVNEKIVCEVNGEAITFDDYKYFFYRHYVSLYGEDISELTSEKFEKVKALTEDSLRRRAYIMFLIDEYDIELSDEQEEKVDYYVSEQIKEQGDQKKYEEYLLNARLTGKVFRDQIELTFFYDPMLRELLSTGVDKRIDVTDAAVIADVSSGNFYRYAQIYYSVDAGELDTNAREKINKAYEKLESGMSFADVASASWASSATEQLKYKSEWTASALDGVYVAKGEKEAIVEDTVFALGEYEYSEPKWSGSGWHIFIRLPIDIEYVKQNLHNVITGENTIAEQSFARRYLEYIENGSKKMKIEYAKYFTSTVTFKMLVQKETLDK